MRLHVEVYITSVLTTCITWLLAKLDMVGGSNILPAIVGILAVIGSVEHLRRDRAERKLIEKKLNNI